MAGGHDPRLTKGWLPALPASWVTARLGNRSWIRARLGWRGLTADEYVASGVPMLSTPDIKGGKLRFDDVNRISAQRYDESPEIKLRVGDVLLTKDGATIGICAVVTDLPEPATVNGSIAVITPDPSVDPRYLRYALASSYAQQVMLSLQGGMGVPHLFQADIKRIVLPFPTPVEQVVIADFLDRETAKIDALIEKQLGMIGLLRERRQAVLDETFEDGSKVHPVRLRRLLVSRPSYGVLVPQYVSEAHESRVPLIRVGDLTTLCTESELPFISTNQSTEYSRTRLIGGEVLLGVVGKMGQSTIAPRDLAGSNVARAVAVLRCARSDAAALLNVWFASTEFLNQAALATGGDTIQPTLGMADLARMVVSWPDDEEVMRTLDRTRERLTSIDQAIGQAGRMVELAQERRAALITAAVTGQLDVSGEAA